MGQKMLHNDPIYGKVNKVTGEIETLTRYQSLPIEEFIMVYLKSLPEMNKLEGNQLKLLMQCWMYCTQDPLYPDYNIIKTSKAFKDMVRNNGVDLIDTSIDSYISQLTKKGFLIRFDKGVYALHPKYFYKGRLSDRSKLMLTFTYGYSQEELDKLGVRFIKDTKTGDISKIID